MILNNAYQYKKMQNITTQYISAQNGTTHHKITYHNIIQGKETNVNTKKHNI